MALDFSKKSDELFLDLVNTKASRALSKDELVVGVPTAGTTGGKNTTVHLSAVPTAPHLTGEADFHYNRLDLTFLFLGLSPTLEVRAGIDSTLAVAAELNSRYGINISELDIEQTSFVIADEPASISLVARDTSLVFSGTVVVDLTYPKDDLNTVMGDGVADGFTKPEIGEF